MQMEKVREVFVDILYRDTEYRGTFLTQAKVKFCRDFPTPNIGKCFPRKRNLNFFETSQNRLEAELKS